ncbi:MAG: hypothetical protein V1817_01110 [Candidatus Micrarchaeota archaeon]
MACPRKKISRRSGSSKAQIALWMLTKMAMVFFILALALVLVGLSAKEKSGLCEALAESLVQNVRSQVVGVVSAPIEDERKVIPLERVLSTGREDFQRYNLTVTWREKGTRGTQDYQQTLVIEAKAASTNCDSGSSLLVPSDYKIHFKGSPQNIKITPRTTSQGAVVELTAEPSKLYGASPSLYLIILKCSTKSWTFEKHLFIEDCKNENPATCWNFETDVIAKCCGWGNRDPASGNFAGASCPDDYLGA